MGRGRSAGIVAGGHAGDNVLTQAAQKIGPQWKPWKNRRKKNATPDWSRYVAFLHDDNNENPEEADR